MATVRNFPFSFQLYSDK